MFVLSYNTLGGIDMYNNSFYQDVNVDSTITGNNNTIQNDMDVDVTMMPNNGMMNQTSFQQPMNEGVQERIINRTFVHEVPHVCPIHTRIINHHVYKHTYRPAYTCSEENVCSNVQCGSCCQFR